jgi:hypothetical protein
MAGIQKTSRKKSSESSDQPKNDAKKAWRCEDVRRRKLARIEVIDPTDIRRSIADRSATGGFL